MKKSLLTLTVGIISFFTSAQITVDFTTDKVEICLGESITFTPIVNPSGTVVSSYIWNFGNGQTSNLQSPIYTYPAANTNGYNITLTIIVNGQSYDVQKQLHVKVNPLPDAKFSILSTDCSAPFEVTIQNNSSNSGDFTYAWNFGNGQISSLQNPGPVTYSTDGVYIISLTVTNQTTGCSITITDDLVVSDYETGILAPLTACVGELVQFLDNSTIGANAWTWNFGGLGSSSIQNPTFTFNTAGTYAISLSSQNTLSGCPSDNVTVDITIHPLPTVSFVADVTSGCSPLNVTFDPSASSGAASLTFEWNYGDGQEGTSNTHTYNANGTYTVSLTVTDANGCSQTFTRTNYIVVQDPIVNFTADVRKGCGPLTVNFSATASSPNPLDPIVEYHWDFGDGNIIITTDPNSVNIFGVGRYNVTLTVYTANGCTATITRNRFILVGNEPVIDFVGDPLQACIKEPINFNSSNFSLYNGLSSSEYDLDEFEWEWEMGTNGMNNTEDPTFPFPIDTGYMDIRFKVTFRGCEKEIIKTDYVYIKPPKASFTVQNVFCDPASFPVVVDVDARGNHPDLPDTKNSIPSQSILGRANYNVMPYQFTDDIVVSWNWGDGSPNTVFNTAALNADFNANSSTSHDFTNYGSYTITQTVVNNTTGCTDTFSQVVHISRVVADYTPSNDSVCLNSALNFNGLTPINEHPSPTAYAWIFNGSSTANSVAQNPTGIVFNQVGLQNVQLTVTNGVGCTSSVTKQIRVLALPVANFTPTNAVGCAPLFVDFTSTSTSVSGVPLETFTWNYGDGTTNELGEHTYVNPNNTTAYNTTLTVIDEFGCRGSRSYPVEVTKPVPVFTLDPVVCNNEIFNLSPLASGIAGPGMVDWIIDGVPTYSTAANVNSTHSFIETSTNLSETHTVVLSIEDRNGCVTVSDPFEITVSLPQANYTNVFSSNSQGSGGSFTCPSVIATVTDDSQSIGDIIQWSWSFGDGSFSNDQNAQNTYVFGGTYDLTLNVTDEFGCSASIVTAPFLQIDGPSARLTVTQDLTSACGQTFIFEMTEEEKVANWFFNFGDGTIVENENPYTYTYKSGGTFTGALYIEDDKGCRVAIPFTLNPATNGILADFSFVPSPEADMGQWVIFTDLSTTPAAGGIVNWDWLFSDGGNINNNTGEDVKHAFSNPGTNYITLTVKDADGCYSQIQKPIIINKNLYIPNVFSPNGDGSNDKWYIPGSPFKSYEIYIYNRWGTVMYKEAIETDGTVGGLRVSWDGRNNGRKLCSDGTYYYILKGTLLDDTTVESTGYITLVDGKD
jgi:gliding motility-associated-like protein